MQKKIPWYYCPRSCRGVSNIPDNVFWWVTGHSNLGLFNPMLQPRTSQAQTFQPWTPQLQTPIGLKNSWWNGLGLRSPGLKCPATYVWTFQPWTSQPKTIQPWTFQSHRGLGLRSSWLKSLGLRSPGLNLGVEKSGVWMSCNRQNYQSCKVDNRR